MAEAGLISRPGGMVYDSDLDITWLADANYAMTSLYDADGLMDWDSANTWANDLVYGGFSDWRLPTADPGCGLTHGECVTNANEMGHLFYHELGGTAFTPITASHNSN